MNNRTILIWPTDFQTDGSFDLAKIETLMDAATNRPPEDTVVYVDDTMEPMVAVKTFRALLKQYNLPSPPSITWRRRKHAGANGDTLPAEEGADV